MYTRAFRTTRSAVTPPPIRRAPTSRQTSPPDRTLPVHAVGCLFDNQVTPTVPHGRRGSHDPSHVPCPPRHGRPMIRDRGPGGFLTRRAQRRPLDAQEACRQALNRENAPHAPLAQSAEHIHGKDGVGGSIPPGGSTTALTSGSSATACASGAGEVAATASALGGCSAGVASVPLRSRRSVVRDPAMSLPPRSGDPAAPPRTAISAGERHGYTSRKRTEMDGQDSPCRLAQLGPIGPDIAERGKRPAHGLRHRRLLGRCCRRFLASISRSPQRRASCRCSPSWRVPPGTAPPRGARM